VCVCVCVCVCVRYVCVCDRSGKFEGGGRLLTSDHVCVTFILMRDIIRYLVLCVHVCNHNQGVH